MMNGSIKRKPATTTTPTKRPSASTAIITPPPSTGKEASPPPPAIIDPSLQAKYNLLQEKQKECEALEKMAETSHDMTSYIIDYCDRLEDLFTGVEGISDTLSDWSVVFGIMREMNAGIAEWVRLNKSLSGDEAITTTIGNN